MATKDKTEKPYNTTELLKVATLAPGCKCEPYFKIHVYAEKWEVFNDTPVFKCLQCGNVVRLTKKEK